MNCNFLPKGFNMNILVLVLYTYVMIYHVSDKDYTTMTVLTVATLLTICFLKKNKQNIMEGASTCSQEKEVEAFTNSPDKEDVKKPVGSQIVRDLPSSMGPYDGLCLQTGNKQYWMPSPEDVQLLPNDALYSYLGSQGPLKPVFSDNSALFGPPIEGDSSSDPKKMFMFANNRTSPNCCPGTFSTSTGCVCTTKKQRDYIANRGHNKGAPASLEDF